jgi:DNA or RNA helicases of superfamily II
MVRILYQGGTIIIDSWFPRAVKDPKTGNYRALGMYYKEILDYFSTVKIEDLVADFIPFPIIEDKVILKDYQIRALKAWKKAGKRGVIVLPTGAGKTYVALKAIAEIRKSTLIVVPTIDLMFQWREKIREYLNFDSGILGAGKAEINGITVSTYDSAYSRIDQIGNKFAFIIFDEAHHLPSLGYRAIAEMSIAPYRLGLTATPEREDGLHKDLPLLIGEVVFTVFPEELAGKHLAEFEIKKVYVDLEEDERREYNRLRQIYLSYIRSKGLRFKTLRDFSKLIILASKDKKAREALLARSEAMRIAINSRAKIEKLKEIFENNKGKKMIVFTRHTDMAYEVSSKFLIPAITYETPKEIRKEILEKFKRGEYSVIVASNVFR